MVNAPSPGPGWAVLPEPASSDGESLDVDNGRITIVTARKRAIQKRSGSGKGQEASGVGTSVANGVDERTSRATGTTPHELSPVSPVFQSQPAPTNRPLFLPSPPPNSSRPRPPAATQPPPTFKTKQKARKSTQAPSTATAKGKGKANDERSSSSSPDFPPLGQFAQHVRQQSMSSAKATISNTTRDARAGRDIGASGSGVASEECESGPSSQGLRRVVDSGKRAISGSFSQPSAIRRTIPMEPAARSTTSLMMPATQPNPLRAQRRKTMPDLPTIAFIDLGSSSPEPATPATPTKFTQMGNKDDPLLIPDSEEDSPPNVRPVRENGAHKSKPKENGRVADDREDALQSQLSRKSLPANFKPIDTARLLGFRTDSAGVIDLVSSDEENGETLTKPRQDSQPMSLQSLNEALPDDFERISQPSPPSTPKKPSESPRVTLYGGHQGWFKGAHGQSQSPVGSHIASTPLHLSSTPSQRGSQPYSSSTLLMPQPPADQSQPIDMTPLSLIDGHTSEQKRPPVKSAGSSLADMMNAASQSNARTIRAPPRSKTHAKSVNSEQHNVNQSGDGEDKSGKPGSLLESEKQSSVPPMPSQLYQGEDEPGKSGSLMESEKQSSVPPVPSPTNLADDLLAEDLTNQAPLVAVSDDILPEAPKLAPLSLVSDNSHPPSSPSPPPTVPQSLAGLISTTANPQTATSPTFISNGAQRLVTNRKRSRSQSASSGSQGSRKSSSPYDGSADNDSDTWSTKARKRVRRNAPPNANISVSDGSSTEIAELLYPNPNPNPADVTASASTPSDRPSHSPPRESRSGSHGAASTTSTPSLDPIDIMESDESPFMDAGGFTPRTPSDTFGSDALVDSLEQMDLVAPSATDRPRISYGREYANIYARAKDLRYDLEDMVNNLAPWERNAPILRLALESSILVNTLDDEPDAPEIKIFNDVDDEVIPPWEFHYSNKMWHGDNVPPPDMDNLRGCDCLIRCDPRSKTCACVRRQQEAHKDLKDINGFMYDEKGRLQFHGYPIFECNDLCQCTEDCRNRVVQLGRRSHIEIMKTPTKGWGVFAAKRIPKGTFIGIYAGELLTDQEGELRGKVYNKVGRTYLFDIDFFHIQKRPGEDSDILYTIDAFHAGNFTRFLNHSCDPNCVISPCYINEANIEKPLLAIFTVRDVDVREELCFSYLGVDDDEANGQDGVVGVVQGSPSKVSASMHLGSKDGLYRRCECGAAKCQGKFFN